MKIVVTQFWTKNLPYRNFTRAINEKYCSEKGYIYHIEENDDKILDNLQGRSYTWYKPKLIDEALSIHNPDYILFLDADAIVCNDFYRIEEFIDDKYNCVVTADHGPSVMNAGVLLFKNNDWTKSFLKKWWEISDKLKGPNNQPEGYYNNGLWHDQTCFGYLYNNDKDIKSKIKIIDNKVLNGPIYKDPKNKNFIFHAFAYGLVSNRTIDLAYYDIFNIPKPDGQILSEMASSYQTDKHYEHNYFNLIYNDLFKDNYLDVKTFIEIGVHKGESLQLWRDYFKNAIVIGTDLDLNLANTFLGNNNLQRIVLHQLDQSNTDSLTGFSSVYTDVDVILDDGTHKMKDQQLTFAKLFKMLRSGGIYIIEDLHTSLEALLPEKRVFNWGDPDKTTTLNMLKNFIDNKVIYSDYMSIEDMEYLNSAIENVEIYRSKPDWSITSVILKK